MIDQLVNTFIREGLTTSEALRYAEAQVYR